MAKEFARTFYNSKAWKQCKEAYIKSVYGLCERCGKPGYIVHHKEKLTPLNINNPEVTLNHNKLEYLCLECHNADELKEHSSNPIRLRYRIDESGNIIPLMEDKQ